MAETNPATQKAVQAYQSSSTRSMALQVEGSG